MQQNVVLAHAVGDKGNSMVSVCLTLAAEYRKQDPRPMLEQYLEQTALGDPGAMAPLYQRTKGAVLVFSQVGVLIRTLCRKVY